MRWPFQRRHQWERIPGECYPVYNRKMAAIEICRGADQGRRCRVCGLTTPSLSDGELGPKARTEVTGACRPRCEVMPAGKQGNEVTAE